MQGLKTYAILMVLLCGLAGCNPKPVAYPISESHSQLTATDYNEAEEAFAGGALASMPDELAAAHCQELLEKRDRASAFTLGLTGLGGAGGLATLLPKDVTKEEQKRWDLSLGLATLATGTAAVILGALTRSWSAEFESECATKPAPAAVPEHPASDEEKDGGAE